MITRGSKFFYGAAAFGFIAAFFYGFISNAAAQGGVVSVLTGGGGVVDSVVGPLTLGWKGGVGEHVGYAVLLGFGALMAAIGGFHTAFRDGDAEATAQVSHLTSAPPVSVPFGLSPWPFITAVSATMVVIGLAMSSIVFSIGLIGLIVAGFEWTVRSWSERATGDPKLNRELRNRFMLPLEVPVGAVLLGGIVIFSVSRILLALNKTGAAVAIILLAVLIFVTAVVLAYRPELKRSVLVGVGVAFAVLVIGGGIAGSVAGEAPLHEEGKKEGAVAVVRTTPVLTDNEVVRG
jgi:hypothetical protein